MSLPIYQSHSSLGFQVGTRQRTHALDDTTDFQPTHCLNMRHRVAPPVRCLSPLYRSSSDTSILNCGTDTFAYQHPAAPTLHEKSGLVRAFQGE